MKPPQRAPIVTFPGARVSKLAFAFGETRQVQQRQHHVIYAVEIGFHKLSQKVTCGRLLVDFAFTSNHTSCPSVRKPANWQAMPNQALLISVYQRLLAV